MGNLTRFVCILARFRLSGAKWSFLTWGWKYLDKGVKLAACKQSLTVDLQEDGGVAASILCGLEIREDQNQNKDSFDLKSTQV